MPKFKRETRKFMLHRGIHGLSALALGLGLLAPGANAQLKLSGYTTGSFEDLSEANTTVVNAPDGSSASFATGIPAAGSTQSKITFENATFSNVGSGDPLQTGLFTITNGVTQLGSGAPAAKFDLGLHLTSPTGTAAVDAISFQIDHTPNTAGGVPDTFSVSFDQPEPVQIGDTLVQFHIDVNPLDFQVAENATVEKGDILVSFTTPGGGGMTPVPEPAAFALWGSALLAGLVAWRGARRRRILPGAPMV
jgi:hypothetical protein